MIGDPLFTQLLYPALSHAGLEGQAIDDILVCEGQPLTDAVVARLRASAPDGPVIHLHDLLGWWTGHRQLFSLKDVLDVADRDPRAALELARQGTLPYGCDPLHASRCRDH